MRGFSRVAFMGGLASIGAILSGVMSFGVNNLHFNGPPSSTPPRKPARKVKRRPGSVRRGWRAFAYEVNTDPNSREATRRRRQIAAGSLKIANGLVP